MSTINDYISGLKNRYPDTQPVREQLEELRDTLHLKAEDLQAHGSSYDDAARDAIMSLGDVTPLLNEVSGNVRTVYINRLNRDNALIGASLILAEFLTGWLVVFLLSSRTLFNAFLVSLLAITVGLVIWPLISAIICHQSPNKTSVVEMPFRKLIRTAILGWLGISLLLFAVNMLVGGPLWFMWPLIGIANWPLNIYLFHKQLTGGRYDKD